MSYSTHFRHADEVVTHLNGVVPHLNDPLLQSKYVGFLSIAAVSVFELAIKDIFISFAYKKHKVLGNFIETFFHRINGRIKIKVIENEYIKKFGEKYSKRFKRKLTQRMNEYLKINRRDIVSSYSNLITWRNDFAHEGKFNTTATYQEVVQSYNDGKEVIHCLAETMTR